jgi:hypothetical protein
MAFTLRSDAFDLVAKMVYREPGPGEERIGFGTMGLRWMRAEEDRVRSRMERIWLHVE